MIEERCVNMPNAECSVSMWLCIFFSEEELGTISDYMNSIIGSKIPKVISPVFLGGRTEAMRVFISIMQNHRLCLF